MKLSNLIIALATLLAAFTSLVKVWGTNRKVNDNTSKLDDVKQLVDGSHDKAMARIDQLGDTLTNAGVVIPSTPSESQVKVMPYEIRKSGENYEVVNTETGEVKATHEPPDAEEKAKKQVALLHHVETDMEDY